MKTLRIFFVCLLFSVPALAQYGSYPTLGSSSNYTNSHYTKGYTRQDGTVVDGYYSTNPNSTNRDNYSTQGNVNPYTGQAGYRAQDYSTEALNYGQGRTIYEGPRGGQYYYNENGRKTYVPKR